MKKFKVKRKHNFKIFMVIIIFFIVFIIVSFFEIKKTNTRWLKYLTKSFGENDTSLYLLSNNLDFLFNNYSFKKTEIVYDNKKIVYLYNTFYLEKYQDGTSIKMVSELLQNNLKKIGIDVLLENNKPSELLHTGLSYYDISRSYLKEIMNNEKNIAYYIDVHQGSINNPTIEINNKKYAKVKFILGLNNKDYENNKKVLKKMDNYLNENYPGISQGIYEKKDIYNQDLGANIILIEIGETENNFEELNNSTEILSLMLYYMLGD